VSEANACNLAQNKTRAQPLIPCEMPASEGTFSGSNRLTYELQISTEMP